MPFSVCVVPPPPFPPFHPPPPLSSENQKPKRRQNSSHQHVSRANIASQASTTRLLPPTQKINTEKYPNIASKYKVEALPTIMLFKEGKVADRIEGMPNAPQLIDRLLYFLQ